ncbi:RmlC-like cupin domain-containing protein [Diaporthe sp. PMI_573]|nr:RmlC-like cupin domain-containing protein [Diaporthaceae sp. PMI_573]
MPRSTVFSASSLIMSIPRVPEPLGKPTPYIIPAYEGESIAIPGTKGSIRILASAKETDGLISVFGYDGVTGDAPGFHYHNEAHDVFMCTRGRMKLWAGDRCKILSPGDFAYVPPKVVHQPQLVDPVNESVGLVTPGQWVDFFRFVTEKYDGIIGDEFDQRNTMHFMFSKIQEIKEKYDVVFQPQFQGAEVSEWSEEDSKLPDGPEPTEYFLRANTGPRYLLEGILARPFITTKQCAGQFAITSIESSNRLSNSILSKPFVFEKVHQVYYVFDGAILIRTDGQVPGDLVRAGETVFIPAGKEVSLHFVDRYVRFWSFASGNGLESLVAGAGDAFEGLIVPDQVASFDVDRVHLAAESLGMKVKL